MSLTPSAQYSLTIRIEIADVPGMLGKVASAIGEAEGTIGAIDLVEVGERLVRDVTVDAADADHWTSILAASPWLIFLFFTPLRRDSVAAGVLVLSFAAALLFYHSNGFSQYNTQRYTLDWLPAAMLMLAAGLRLDHVPVLRLLIVWGMALNVATVATTMPAPAQRMPLRAVTGELMRFRPMMNRNAVSR